MNNQRFADDTVFWTTIRGKRFCFHTQGEKQVHSGDELLIQHMNIGPTDMVLDLTCGFGARGIVAATLTTQGHVHMVDTNASAIDYARENAAINHSKRIETYLSEGFASVGKDRTFHTILFRMPEGTKKDVLPAFIAEAKEYLKDNGKLYMVTVSGLRHIVREVFEKEFGNYEKVSTAKGYILTVGEKTHV